MSFDSHFNFNIHRNTSILRNVPHENYNRWRSIMNSTIELFYQISYILSSPNKCMKYSWQEDDHETSNVWHVLAIHPRRIGGCELNGIRVSIHINGILLDMIYVSSSVFFSNCDIMTYLVLFTSVCLLT